MQQLGKNKKELKAAMPYGSLSEIAKRSETSIYTVSRVVNGKSNNNKVLKEISLYLKERVNTMDTIRESAISLTA